MTEAARIADQLARAYNGDAWHGTPLLGLLEGVTGEQAFSHPVRRAHSIVELVLHIGTWMEVVRRRLSGEVVQLTSAEDWPRPFGARDEAEWQQALATLDHSYRALHRTISTLSDKKLEQVCPGKDYPNYVMLHGVVQHLLYHAGQIALLKAALAAK